MSVKNVKLTMSWGEFRSLASLAECASKDKVTPIIMSILFSVGEENIVGVSTDRYRVGRVTIPRDGFGSIDERGIVGDSFVVAADDVKKLAATLKPSMRSGADVVFAEYEYDDDLERDRLGRIISGVLRVSSPGGVSLSAPFTQNVSSTAYPAVVDLMDNAAAIAGDAGDNGFAPNIGFSVKYLASLDKLMHPADRGKSASKNNVWRMFASRLSDSSKPMPVYWRMISEHGEGNSVTGGYGFEYLLQPNLLKGGV